MSTSLVLRPLPMLVIAAALVACGAEPRSQQVRRDHVVIMPILADVPIGPGWEVVTDAPILADVPVGPGWDAS